MTIPSTYHYRGRQALHLAVTVFAIVALAIGSIVSYEAVIRPATASATATAYSETWQAKTGFMGATSDNIPVWGYVSNFLSGHPNGCGVYYNGTTYTPSCFGYVTSWDVTGSVGGTPYKETWTATSGFFSTGAWTYYSMAAGFPSQTGTTNCAYGEGPYTTSTVSCAAFVTQWSVTGSVGQ